MYIHLNPSYAVRILKGVWWYKTQESLRWMGVLKFLYIQDLGYSRSIPRLRE